MSQPTKFTIVTPSFNNARYIGRTIESVLSQQGDFEIEYLIQDGGSTDGSVDIIRDYAERVEKNQWDLKCRGLCLRWVSQADRGQSDAINQGFRQGSGAIAAYINSDDAYLPGAFAAVAQAFEQNPDASFVHGDGEVVDEEGRPQWEWLSRPYDHSVMTSYHFLWNGFTNYIMQPSTFWTTKVRTAIGEFDESFHFAMDAEYWIRAGHARLKFIHVPIRLAQFRMIPGTKSLSSPVAFWSDYLEIFRRYRGLPRMAVFFGYYCYNLALHAEFDLDRVLREESDLLKRWTSLPPAERVELQRQARKGFALGCCLAANELRRRGRFDKAAEALRRGASESWTVALHPIILYFRLKQALPSSASASLDRLADYLVASYRRRRVEYRYHQK